mmetsp:Transcript_15961/g.37845  ORF Transcript_15961/g.37845 Transcript_15961/m.37845 type:complete len:271 (-) Transcript_15961:3035-3847(-)
MRACHRHNLRLPRHEVVDPVPLPLEQLKGAALLELLEHGPQVAEAALGRAPVLGKGGALEEGLRRSREVLREREVLPEGLAVLGRLHQRPELLPAAQNVEQPEVRRGLARVRDVGGHAKLDGHLLNLREQLQAALEHGVDAPHAREVELRVEVLLPLAEAEEVTGRDVSLHDLCEEVVQRLVGVGDQQSALVRVRVVQHVHDLNSHVCFARPGRANHHGEPRLNTRQDRLHLHWGEAHRVLPWLILWIGSWIWGRVRLDYQRFAPTRKRR